MEIEGILLNGQVLGVNDDGNITVDGVTFTSEWVDPIDSLTSYSTDAPLTANQGRVIKDFIDTLNAIVASDDVALNTLQEVVTFIKANKATLDNLEIHHINGLTAALSDKLEVAEALVLGVSETTAFRGDLGLLSYNHSQEIHAAIDAQANVQSDWIEADTGDDAFIKNKPTIIDGGNY